MGDEQGVDLVGFRGADAGEQPLRLLPAGPGGVDVGRVAQGVAEHDQSPSLAEAIAGGSLDVKGLSGTLGGPVDSAFGEVEVGESRQGPPFQDAVAGPAGEGEGLVEAAMCLAELAEVPVGGG